MLHHIYLRLLLQSNHILVTNMVDLHFGYTHSVPVLDVHESMY